MVQSSSGCPNPPPLPSSSSTTSSLSRSSSSGTLPNADCNNHHHPRNINHHHYRSKHPQNNLQHQQHRHHQSKSSVETIMAEGGGGGSGRISRAGSGGLGNHTDCSDDDLDAAGHILDRVNKSDRMPVTKPEEDRRRRTIIIEKKNNSYGFTLQSYGIHYKKEQEIEMITYVDYVEYDGPAYKSGMREGDVILSINGSDMEKADHKTLVAFIKGCDTRMRMVVLFEDCVRKVELHMRYIHLQTILQGKMNELERTCLRERELLEGKWKTHSLPARKKVGTATGTAEGLTENNLASPSAGGDAEDGPQAGSSIFCRPAMSTEDVHILGRHQKHQQLQHVIPPPAQFMLTYQYLDPHCRYVLRPSMVAQGSDEYLLSIAGPPPRSKSDHHHVASDVDGITVADSQQQQQHQHKSHYHQHQSQHHSQPAHSSNHHAPSSVNQSSDQMQQNTTDRRSVKTNSNASSRTCHGHSCNPCLGHRKDKSSNNGNGSAGGDNVSLEAYDLASPCCNPHCVPTRRRTKHHKEHHHKHKHRDKEQKEQRPQRPRSQSHADSAAMHSMTNHHHPMQQSQHNEKHSHRPRFYDITAGLASHCSLHSCTSSEFGAPDGSASHHCHGGGESSVASYSTSLSTDTLYWDPETNCQNSRQQSTKSRQSTGSSSAYPNHNLQHTPTHSAHSQQQHQSYNVHPTTHHHQQPLTRYHIHAAQIQPTSYDYHVVQQPPYIQKKPKSWDNLALKGIGGYGFGYGYLDTVGQMAKAKISTIAGVSTATMPVVQSTTNQQHSQLPNTATLLLSQQQLQQQQRHSMPRKNPYGRYSTFSDVENYAPPPSQFVQTITTTTITKSTENLLGTTFNHSDTSLHSCEGCNEPLAGNPYVTQLHNVPPTTAQAKYHDCRGYYSHLPRVRTTTGNVPPMSQGNNTTGGSSSIASGVTNSTSTMGRPGVATVSEITRL